MNKVGQMTIEERAARIYCEQKGIDPDQSDNNWGNLIDPIKRDFDRLSFMLYCLKQAENTK